MKTFELCAVAAALVLSFTTLSVAQAPMGTPAPAMSGKGEMKEADGMKKESAGMMEKKQPYPVSLRAFLAGRGRSVRATSPRVG